MKIFISGGAGFLGTHLTDFLINQGHSIVIFDNFSNSKINFSDQQQIKVVKGDILDFQNLCKSMKNIDLVIHLAAQINVEDSIKNPEKTFKINVEGTKNLLFSCQKNNIKNLIAASTAAVFGNISNEILNEHSQTIPISSYGESKLKMEKEIIEFSNRHNLNSIILRFFNLYGPGQSSQYAGVISKFLENINKNHDLEIFGTGNQTRDFIHVDDAVNSFNLALNNIDGKIGEIYNVGSGKGISILELAKLMLEISGKKLQVIHNPPLKGDIRFSQTTISKINKDLGFVPTISLETGISKFFD